MDTLGVRPFAGVVFKHFTARDPMSRRDVIEVHGRVTAGTARTFLDDIEQQMPFSVRVIQVDGGLEFEAEFEQECEPRGIRLFVWPPRSPKLTEHVERAQRAHTGEFYEVYDLPWTVAELGPRAIEWERIYNTVGPHQTLRQLTPHGFLEENGFLATRCH